MNAPPILFEEGWICMETGITKLKKILKGEPEPQFSVEQYMILYITVYNMCTQKPPNDYSQQLYDKYKEAFVEYINSMVLPSLREKHGEFMLRELVKHWSNHKVMVRWLSRFFHYLDRYFITRRSLPGLHEVGLTCFRDSVYAETKGRAKDAVIALINQEREGEQIDRALLNNVLGIYVEIGMGQMDYYENDFEAFMLADSADYYARKASNWIKEDSCHDYMLKAEDCLKKENDRVDHYLHSSSRPKLIEKLQNELLVNYSSQLLEKEHSGCRTLLRDNKVDDLTRMYKLFSKIPKGLDPVANMFKQHVTAEGMTLVQQADDAASSKSENVGGPLEQVFAKKVIDLHDKFMAYVTDCFSNHTLFHKALKEAFEVFSNKIVAGCSSAEQLLAYCDNILKKGSSEKLSDEASEETFKIVKLLAYIWRTRYGYPGTPTSSPSQSPMSSPNHSPLSQRLRRSIESDEDEDPEQVQVELTPAVIVPIEHTPICADDDRDKDALMDMDLDQVMMPRDGNGIMKDGMVRAFEVGQCSRATQIQDVSDIQWTDIACDTSTGVRAASPEYTPSSPSFIPPPSPMPTPPPSPSPVVSPLAELEDPTEMDQIWIRLENQMLEQFDRIQRVERWIGTVDRVITARLVALERLHGREIDRNQWQRIMTAERTIGAMMIENQLLRERIGELETTTGGMTAEYTIGAMMIENQLLRNRIGQLETTIEGMTSNFAPR